jgi:lysophospholipase L1-like esterase
MWAARGFTKKSKMKITLIVLITAAALSMSFMKQQKKKIVFFGDSITELGARPGGYIKQLDTLLIKKGMSSSYELVGAGISGNKVYDLYLRMDDDVLAKNPDVVVIWIGVNDVWHKRSLGTGTDADKFEKFYNAVIRKLKEKNITVYLCTPAAIGEKTDNTNELDGDLNKYSFIIRNIAVKNGLKIFDFRKLFFDYIKSNNPENKDRGILTTDGVHLNAKGNQMVAQWLYDGLLNEKIFK